jgi:hypothetical protein
VTDPVSGEVVVTLKPRKRAAPKRKRAALTKKAARKKK